MNRQTVAVVDYGMGNLRSVAQAVAHAAAVVGGVDVAVTSDPKVVRNAHRVVLPGQGAMPDCMHELARSGLRDAVLEAAQNKPLLGVCVGMQMLLERSEEGDTAGLGLIPGEVLRFRLQGKTQADGSRCKVPQMGWNRVFHESPNAHAHPMWRGIASGSYFYFVHSFYAQPLHAQHDVAQADYGGRFSCAIARDGLFATQFHPEKSATQGLALYRNFLQWSP